MIAPLPFQWPYALIFWIVFAWAFAPEFAIVSRARRAAAGSDDAGSMRLIMIGNEAAMVFGISAAWLLPLATFPAHRVAAFWGGTSLFLAGTLLRRHCFRVLGRFFTGSVTVQADHEVIDRGAYHWVRHPSYTGGMAMFSGMGIAFGNWISIALLTAIPIAVYSYRVAVEERALLKRLGEPYRAYMERRKRFIPFVI